MITICHPVDDVELMFLRSALEAAEIPYYVHAQHFGSLYPGMQIPWYNERQIRVPPSCAQAANEVVAEVRSTYSPTFENLSGRSKLRILMEALVCAWIVPAGCKRPSNPQLNTDARQETPRAG